MLLEVDKTWVGGRLSEGLPLSIPDLRTLMRFLDHYRSVTVLPPEVRGRPFRMRLGDSAPPPAHSHETPGPVDFEVPRLDEYSRWRRIKQRDGDVYEAIERPVQRIVDLIELLLLADDHGAVRIERAAPNRKPPLPKIVFAS